MPAGSNRDGFRIYGEREVLDNITLFVGRKVEVASLETKDQAEAVRDLGVQYAPRDTGALADSIVVEELAPGPGVGRDVRSGRFRAGPLGFRVAVGGSNVNPKSGQPTSTYAAKVHETHATKAKFLERAAQAVAKFWPKLTAARMAKA